MERPLPSVIAAVLIAWGLAGCGTDGIASALSLHATSALMLRQLPTETKIYFRQRVLIPTRVEHLALPLRPEDPELRRELIIDAAEVDRTISPSTPLLVDRVASQEGGQTAQCSVTLSLVTTGGQSLRFRAYRARHQHACTPMTVEDISDLVLVIPFPPVPLQ